MRERERAEKRRLKKFEVGDVGRTGGDLRLQVKESLALRHTIGACEAGALRGAGMTLLHPTNYLAEV